VYQFVGEDHQTWTRQATLSPPETFPEQSNLFFGYSSALTENWLAISAVGYGK
jgi:hypothetical protein